MVMLRGLLNKLCAPAFAALLLLTAAASAQATAPTAARTPAPAPKTMAGAKTPDPMAPGVTGSARLAALLERVKLAQKGMRTMEARFVQKQESAMLLQPEESRGTFSYQAPDRVRWEYSTPNPISIVIQGDDMTTWYRDLDRAEKLKIGRYSNQFFKYLGTSGNLETLREYFDVKLQTPAKKGDPFRMELLPRYARIAKRIKTMTIWIDSERYFPNRVQYVGADGDTTEYLFQDIKLNSPIPADRFVLRIPKGVDTKVIDLSGEGNGKAAAKPRP
jgi:outer membrane lipoprotein carrier protein